EDAERDAEELLHAPPARASTASRSSATRARSASSSDAVSGTAPAADRSPPDSRATQARAVTTSAVASATAARPASRCAEEMSSGGTRVVRAVVDPSSTRTWSSTAASATGVVTRSASSRLTVSRVVATADPAWATASATAAVACPGSWWLATVQPAAEASATARLSTAPARVMRARRPTPAIVPRRAGARTRASSRRGPGPVGRRRPCPRATSGAQQGLDRAALVHRGVALRGVVERELEVEHARRVDAALEHEVDELRQVLAHGRRAAAPVDVAVEHVDRGQVDAVRQPDDADVPARPDRAEGLRHRVLRADGLDDAVRAEPVGELADALDSLLAALRDDLRRTEGARELLARRVPAHRDHLLGAELRGREHGEQPDGAVAHDD